MLVKIRKDTDAMNSDDCKCACFLQAPHCAMK